MLRWLPILSARWTAALLPAALLVALAPAAVRAEPYVARYEVHAAGMVVMRAAVLLDLDAPGGGYRVMTQVRLTGMAGLLSSGEQLTSAEGRWQGARPEPLRYRVEGTWRGAPRRIVLDYPSPGVPVLRVLVPPNEAEREPVPPDLQRGTMDSLSALAQLTRTVAATGRCDVAAATFDGRRLAEVAVRTQGVDLLPGRPGAPGREALRCGFESRLVAGRRADQDAEAARRAQPATAWLAQAAPSPWPLPVRIELPSRWFGMIRIELVGVERAGPGSALQQLAEQGR